MESKEALENDERERRPVSSWKPEMIKKVCDNVKNDHNASLKMLEHRANFKRKQRNYLNLFHEVLGKSKVCAKFFHTL